MDQLTGPANPVIAFPPEIATILRMNHKIRSHRSPCGLFITLVLAAALPARSGFTSQPGGGIITSIRGAQAGLSEGEELLGRLNCAGCHAAPDEVKARLSFKTPPLLGRVAERASIPWIKHFILDPAATKPGTTMPNMLGGLAPEEQAAAADDLTHYLASLREWKAPQPAEAEPALIEEGERLFHTVGCVACHAPQAPASRFVKNEVAAVFEDEAGNKDSPPKTGEGIGHYEPWRPFNEAFDSSGLHPSEPLPDLAVKMRSTDALAAFLADPLAARPSGRMPSLRLSGPESTALAHYLLRGQSGSGADLQRLPGLKYDYYERDDFPPAADFGNLKPKKSGAVAAPNLGPRQRQNGFGFKFTGFVTVTESDFYKFWLRSDDGSRLYIGDKLVVNNDGYHGAIQVSGVIPLAAGEHPITITYFDAGGDTQFEIWWQGPGFKRAKMPAEVFSHDGVLFRPADDPGFTVDADKVRRGGKLFATLGCANCHSLGEGFDEPARVLAAAPWGALDGTRPGGCLSTRTGTGAARFALTEGQRTAMTAALKETQGSQASLTPSEAAARTMARMNCHACHQRGGVEGIEPARQDYFISLDEAEMGDEGRIPPNLTGVGGKLRTGWLREILVKGRVSRPYMATRMPQFGEANVRTLPVLLGASDATPGDLDEPPFTAEQASIGWKLAGVKGFACVQCHTVNGRKSLGIPGLDLGTAHRRLRPGWFRRFLENPIAINKGTRMPTFWPDGESPFKDVLGGDPHGQMNALWAYLSLGESMRTPEGMEDRSDQYELVPVDGPIIFGVFMKGVGPRAIAVGFPDRLHAAYDADTARMARFWRGDFLNAQSSWEGRAGGVVNPRGLELPGGPPVSKPLAEGVAWPEFPKDRQTSGAMRGYDLDPTGNPIFRSQWPGGAIEEQVVPVVQEGGVWMRRSLAIRRDSGTGPLWLRLATGRVITTDVGGLYQITPLDGPRWTLRLAPPPEAKVFTRSSGTDSTDLVIEIPGDVIDMKVEAEVTWQ